MIWWEKFICNFKYIFINKTSFIKNNCNSCRQIWSKVLQGGVGLCRVPRSRDEVRKFFPSCKVVQGRKPHPSNQPRPIAIPSHILWECKIAKETWNNSNFKLGNLCCPPKEFLDVVWLLKEDQGDRNRAKTWSYGAILLLVVCNSSSLRLCCLTANGLFIYLFVCFYVCI